MGKKLAASGNFHLEGDRLIYEPSFKDPRKKVGEASVYQNIINKIISKGQANPELMEEISRALHVESSN